MNNTLSEGDRAIVREIATEAAEVINRRIEKEIDQAIRLHQATCPGASFPIRLKLLVVGVGLGSGLLSAGTIAGLAKLF